MEEKIKQIMADIFDLSVDEINENSSIDTIESWDSIQHLNLILAIEETFDISFEPDEMSEMISFVKIKRLLPKYLN